MTELEQYYNKFNEEKRLSSRHGIVEFTTTMKYIHTYLDEYMEKHPEISDKSELQILDVGAGTGRYSVMLAGEGYDVTAVELVQYNLGILKSKNSSVKAYKGNALKLSRFKDNTFDMTLVFGPMYHLFAFEDKLKALSEAKRVTKPGGMILVAYVMNEYSVIMYAFRENKIHECLKENRLTPDFHTVNSEKDLYDYVRLEDIDKLVKAADLERIKIIAADGPSDYMRRDLNAMDDATFEQFIAYHLATCERMDLMGATSHTVDILTKKEEADAKI